MSWLSRFCLVLALAFALPGCKCEKAGSQGQAVSAEDDSALGQFRKKRRTVRKRRKTQASNPPTREDGVRALEEARFLIEEADFREAELELKIAAAAGTEGADQLLYRVQTELAAEARIVDAQKRIAALDYEGARGELEQVPSGLILSAISQQLLESLNELEAEKRNALVEKASQRFAEEEGKKAPPADEPEAETEE